MSFFTSESDIRKKLSKEIKTLSDYKLSIIKIILERFHLKYRINFLNHVKNITRVGFAIDEGFDFTPTNSFALRDELMATNRFIDDSKSIIGKIASSQTNGYSYREMGKSEDKSLHCALSLFKCSVHLDETLFTPIGPDGKGNYNPNLFQHIGYDLFWRDMVVRKFNNVAYLGWTLNRIHPFFPHSSNKYKKIGVMFDINKSKKYPLQIGIEADVNYKLPTIDQDIIKNPRKLKFFGISNYGALLRGKF